MLLPQGTAYRVWLSTRVNIYILSRATPPNPIEGCGHIARLVNIHQRIWMEDNFGLILELKARLKGKWTASSLKDVSVEAEIQRYVLGLESTLRHRL